MTISMRMDQQIVRQPHDGKLPNNFRKQVLLYRYTQNMNKSQKHVAQKRQTEKRRTRDGNYTHLFLAILR